MSLLVTGLFDADGYCLGITDGDPPFGDEVVFTAGVPVGTNPNDVWFDTAASLAKPREPFDLLLPDSIQVNDALAITVPLETDLFVNGAKVTLDTNRSYTHDTSVNGDFRFQLRGRYAYYKQLQILTAEEIAKRDEKNALSANQLINATPQQIENYVDTNVTDLESAKSVITLLAKLVIIGFRKTRE